MPNAADVDARLDPGVPRRRDVSAAGLCTWRVGGSLALVVEPRDLTDLQSLAAVVPADLPILVVGRGSNLLVSDGGFAGVTIVLGAGFETIALPDLDPSAEATGLVAAGGAVALPVLARRCAAAGLTGLEFFVGIPGSVGGAVRMNAGGHGRQTEEVLAHATVFDLRTGTVAVRTAPDLHFSYRHSAVGSGEVVLDAAWQVRTDDPARCAARVDEIVAWRRAHQPGGANAGSVFANPPGDSAGRLIESCGLKGFRIGGAVVSDKHANFIQAEAGATADDVVHLIRHVAAEVESRTGIALRPEVQLVGAARPAAHDEPRPRAGDPRTPDDEVRT